MTEKNHTGDVAQGAGKHDAIRQLALALSDIDISAYNAAAKLRIQWALEDLVAQPPDAPVETVHSCPCGAGSEPCPGPDGRPLCAQLPCSAGRESAADTEMYRLRDLIAPHIACEEDCQKMPTGCGCALTAARAVMNGGPQTSAVQTERDRCVAICEGWMERFKGTEIQYTSAREYACDAINDIMDLIRDGVDPSSSLPRPHQP